MQAAAGPRPKHLCFFILLRESRTLPPFAPGPKRVSLLLFQHTNHTPTHPPPSTHTTPPGTTPPPPPEMSSDKLLFKYHDDAQVTEGDQTLFKPPGWLNDRCINFYFRVLEHEEFPDRPDLLFMDPAVVSCMLIQCTGKC